MRIALFLILGVFLWAGTVSVKFPKHTSTVTASSKPACSDQSYGDLLLADLKMGTISKIHDNGQILTISLSPQWSNLSASVRQKTHDTVVCYAQSQHRPFQFHVSQQM